MPPSDDAREAATAAADIGTGTIHDSQVAWSQAITPTIATMTIECGSVNRSSSGSRPTSPLAAHATVIDCGEIIFPVTPPEEFDATVRIGLRSSRFAETCCSRPKSALADVSDPVMKTPSQPSTGEKNANNGPVAANDHPS